MPIIAYLGVLKNPPSEEEWQQTMGKAGELYHKKVNKICRLRFTSLKRVFCEVLFYHKFGVSQH